MNEENSAVVKISVANKMEFLLTVMGHPVCYAYSHVASYCILLILCHNIHSTTMWMIKEKLPCLCHNISNQRRGCVVASLHHLQGRTRHLDFRTLGLALLTPGLVTEGLPVHPQPVSGEEAQTDPDVARRVIFLQLFLDQHHLCLWRHAGQVVVMFPAVLQSFLPSLSLPHHDCVVAEEGQSKVWCGIVPCVVKKQAVVFSLPVVGLTLCPEKRGHLSASRPRPFLSVCEISLQSDPDVPVAAGKVLKLLHVLCTTDRSQVCVKQPAVPLSIIPSFFLLDANVLAESCRQAQQEQDAGEGLTHRCLVSKNDGESCSILRFWKCIYCSLWHFA